MKKTLILLFALFSVNLFYAHSAKNIILTFDEKNSELSIDAIHKVSNEKKHYINQFIIFVNDKQIFEKKYNLQTNKDEQKDTVKIEAKAGDKIKVNSNCNLGGKKSGELLVK